MKCDDCKNDPCKCAKVSTQSRKNLLDTGVPVKVLFWAFPILFAVVSWWSQVRELPAAIKDIKEIAVDNKNTNKLQDQTFEHIKSELGDIKTMLTEIRSDQRSMHYRNRRHTRTDHEEDGG